MSQASEPMRALPNVRLRKIGECIYCDSTDGLEDEHLVPAALNGNHVLADASCRRCATITSAFESQAMNALRHTRAALGMGTKRKKATTRTAPASVVVKGYRTAIHLPYKEHANLIVLPEFPMPGCLAGRQADAPLTTAIEPIVLGYGADPRHVAHRFDASEIRFEQRMPNVAFAKLVAKIAYAQARVDFARDSFAEIPVVPAILGAPASNIAHWVGTASRTSSPAPDPNTLHRITTRVYPATLDEGYLRFVVGEVTLFANAPAPIYLVVIGLLRRDTVIPSRFAATPLTGPA